DFHPLIGNTLLVMAKVSEIEFESPVRLEPDDFVHGFHEGRRSVRRKSHDLVLVAVIGKSKELRHRLIENAERMGKIDPPFDRDACAMSSSPRRTREIAETIDREHRRLVERRYMKGR